MVEQLNNLNNGNMPLFNLNENIKTNIEVSELISDYLSVRWEEHANLVNTVLNLDDDINDELRRKRFKELILNNLTELRIAVPYRLNPLAKSEGWFLGLKNKRIYSFFSEKLIYIYNNEGHIEIIYKRNPNKNLEEDLYLQITQKLSPENLLNTEEKEEFNSLLDMFLKGSIVDGLANLKKPFLLDSEINDKLKEIYNIQEFKSFDSKEFSKELLIDIQKINKELWTKKFKIVTLNTVHGVIIKQDLEPIFLINNDGIVDLIKSKIIHKNSKDTYNGKICLDTVKLNNDCSSYYSDDFNKINEKLILKALCKTVKRNCTKKRFLGIL